MGVLFFSGQCDVAEVSLDDDFDYSSTIQSTLWYMIALPVAMVCYSIRYVHVQVKPFRHFSADRLQYKH